MKNPGAKHFRAGVPEKHARWLAKGQRGERLAPKCRRQNVKPARTRKGRCGKVERHGQGGSPRMRHTANAEPRPRILDRGWHMLESQTGRLGFAQPTSAAAWSLPAGANREKSNPLVLLRP